MLNLYIANLGKYNEGHLVGAWLELPKTEEEIKQFLAEKVGINEEYEEWAIHDYEKDIEGLSISEYDNIYELNELAEQIEGLDKCELLALQAYLEDGCSFNDAIEHVNDSEYMIFSNCDDMSDVAEQYADEVGLLDSMPEDLRFYFDFERYGRDMEIEGNFHYIDGDYIQLTY